MRVHRGQSNGHNWELWLRTPPPALEGLVSGLWAGDSDADSAFHSMLPDGEFWLMFNLGPPQRVSGEIYRTTLMCGLQEHPVGFASTVRHPCCVSVRFRPLGAWTFFGGLPLTEMANQVVDLESVLGGKAGVEPLRQRLLECSNLGAALELLEDWLIARLLTGPAAHPVTLAALDSLNAQNGSARVASVARDAGLSSRHLNGLFHREIGLPAKSLMRIQRFQHALDRLCSPTIPDLATLAQDCGYYDQAHMNLDFRDLAGMTPTEYTARVYQLPGWREIGG